MVRRSLIALGVSALAVPIVAIGGLGSAGAASPMVRLSGSSLPSARLAANNPAVARSARVRFQVQLRLRDQAGADALAQAVSTPGSAQYRQYLTPEQYRARFSPDPGLGRHRVGVAGVAGPEGHRRAGQPCLRRGRGQRGAGREDLPDRRS